MMDIIININNVSITIIIIPSSNVSVLILLLVLRDKRDKVLDSIKTIAKAHKSKGSNIKSSGGTDP